MYCLELLDDVEPLVEHFKRTWIGYLRRGGNRRDPPQFMIDLWNCYQLTLDCDPRTTNALKAYHRGFNSLVGADHPTIWRFLKALKQQLVQI